MEASRMSDDEENTPVELILHIVQRLSEGQKALREELGRRFDAADRRVDALSAHTDRRIDALQAHTDRRIDDLKAHQDVVALALSQIHGELVQFHARLDRLDRHADVVDGRLDRLETRVDRLDQPPG